MVTSVQLIKPYLDLSQCDTMSLKYFFPTFNWNILIEA